jgi:hypothetical protein
MPVALLIAALAQAVEVLHYHMSRAIQAIPELWRELTVGLQIQPAIEKLDEIYGSS